jgi:predicted O-methyltransferase YrrM
VDFKTAVRNVVKEGLHRTPWRRFAFPHYDYMMSPAQLCFLCAALSESLRASGCLIEIGCANGATTVFLNRFLDDAPAAADRERTYWCLDTFGGFVPEHVDYEVRERGVTADIRTAFAANNRAWFDRTMAANGVTRVRSIEGDAATFDYASIAPIAFCLLDVDLYLPTRQALPRIVDALAPGGVLVVDDCDPRNTHWNGASQAYEEFVRERGLTSIIEQGKLGVIRKAEPAPVAHRLGAR